MDFWQRVAQKNAVLNPVDRISEILFGLIMVLTFTGSISVSNDGHEEIRALLWAALGCNVAWGFVDAIMYLMNVLFERGYGRDVISKLIKSKDDKESRKIIRDEIQPLISNLMTDDEIDSLNKRMKILPDPSKKILLLKKDFLAALQIFFLVLLCTLPVTLPFGIFRETEFALRISNGVALLMLFIGGYILASYAGLNKWLSAFVYMMIGVVLVFITIALGG